MKSLLIAVLAFVLVACSAVASADAGDVVSPTDGSVTQDSQATDAIATDAPPSRYGTCTGFDTSTCSTGPIGTQVLCTQSRCLIACGSGLTCPPEDGTTCQMVGAYEACQ